MKYPTQTLKLNLLILIFSMCFLSSSSPQHIYSSSNTKVDAYGFEMVYVPSGIFEMGISKEGLDKFCQSWLEPSGSDAIQTKRLEACKNEFGANSIGDQIEIQSFWIDKYEVTISQFEACNYDGICPHGHISHDEFYSPNQPQVAITWYEAQLFCNIRDARLPTEQEWEYAASGPENFDYPWGDNFDEKNLPALNTTYEVGKFPGNVSWAGVFDMAGNAEEWVDSRYLDYLTGEALSASGYTDALRVVRGGSWGSGAMFATTFYRNPITAFSISETIGFRCVKSTDPDK